MKIITAGILNAALFLNAAIPGAKDLGLQGINAACLVKGSKKPVQQIRCAGNDED
ncbi:MAG: hypothetical protein HQ469_10525 [Cyanobacteria bacterium]|nr:hypothetical protein [Cyanobacteria bacterium bin.275]